MNDSEAIVIENDFYQIILKMKVTQDQYTIFWDLVGVGRGKLPRTPRNFCGVGNPIPPGIILQL